MIVDTLFSSHPEITWENQGLPSEVQEITIDELKSIAAKIPRGRAPGLDVIPDTIVKAVSIGKPEILLDLFNACLREGVSPIKWKQAKLVLLKKGQKFLEQPSSYKPICLLDTVGQFFERILKSRLETHLEFSNNLSDRQFGFCKNKSTVDAISDIMEEVNTIATEPLHRRNHSAMISLDVTNAFNTAS